MSGTAHNQCGQYAPVGRRTVDPVLPSLSLRSPRLNRRCHRRYMPPRVQQIRAVGEVARLNVVAAAKLVEQAMHIRY